eukprot:TRINITY_DN9904_c0_g1_i1.p1 TRINITY_DN9904_c0_g1~~TRINITY_DN9904_c0_g1_i1.p1  ORF type:complete len:234 (-),score=29.48 TRINITY_DN9904_c0_g1_i1:69-770(-)
MAEPPATSHYFPASSFQSGQSPFISSIHDVSTAFHLPPQNAFSTRFLAPTDGNLNRQYTVAEPRLDLEEMMTDYGPGFSPSSLDDADMMDTANALDEADQRGPSSQDMDVDSEIATLRRKRKFADEIASTDDPLGGVASRIKRLKIPPGGPDDGDKIHIFVKTVTGKRVELVVDPEDLVLRVKEQLEQLSSIPASQQRLLFKGKHMADLHELYKYDVTHACTLYMVTQLTGGS